MDNVSSYRHRGGFTSGNLAYDFAYPEAYPDFTLDQPREPAAQPKTRERAVPRAVPKTKQALAPFALVGFACAAVLLVFSLMAQVRLTAISDEAAQLESRLQELSLEEAKLQIAYESAFNLTEIEEYAIRELGMQKPRSDQVVYVDGSAPDKTVILEAAENESSLPDKIGDFLSSIGEYFG